MRDMSNEVDLSKRIIMKKEWWLTGLYAVSVNLFKAVEHAGLSLKAIFFLERTGTDTV
jgi:hypothetical protein